MASKEPLLEDFAAGSTEQPRNRFQYATGRESVELGVSTENDIENARRVQFSDVDETEFQGKKKKSRFFAFCSSRYLLYSCLWCVCVILSLVAHFAIGLDIRERYHAYITVIVLVFVIVMLVDNNPPEVVLFGASVLLISCKVVDPKVGLQGYSDKNVLAIAVLFIVARGVQESGGMEILLRMVLGSPRFTWTAQLRLLIPVGIVSAFLNNTPVVAMMIPMVLSWSARSGIPSSKLLLPLSYVSMLGGTCTLIGSSTNLVAITLAQKDHNDLKIGFFELSYAGIPLFVVGVIYMIVASSCLLPSSSSSSNSELSENAYQITFTIETGSSLHRESVDSTGLMRVEGASILSICDREGAYKDVDRRTVLHSGDILGFGATANGIRDLRKFRGLVPVNNQLVKLGPRRRHRRMFEVVISRHCSFVNQTVREARFRSEYNGAILAVRSGDIARRMSRQAEEGSSHADDIKDHTFSVGDTLLVETFPNFYQTYRNARHFALISEVEDSKPPRNDQAMDIFRLWASIIMLIVMVIVVAFEKLDLFCAAAFCAGALIAIKCLTVDEALKAVKGNVIIVIASTITIGESMKATGIAQSMADGLVKALGKDYLLQMSGIYVLVVVLGSVISNNATVTLVWPIADIVAAQVDKSYKGFLYIVMFAASASFATPIGYQTNLMVLNPGNYRFSHYLIFGGPMQLVMMVATIPLVVWIYT